MTNPEATTFIIEPPLDLIKEVQTLLRTSGIPMMKDTPKEGDSRT